MGVLDPSTVRDWGDYYGWYEHDYQWSQGELVILRKDDDNGDTMQLNIWCTTGTVGSYLNHPRRGKTQLFRRDVDSYGALKAILSNPRVHGQGGYYERAATQPKKQRTVPCPGCGRKYVTMADTAQHYESGRCANCPGAENAGRAAYAYARQMEERAGMRFTTGQRALTFNGDGERDWSGGYDASGGDNYRCPSCGKGFRALHSLLSHCQARETLQHSARSFILDVAPSHP